MSYTLPYACTEPQHTWHADQSTPLTCPWHWPQARMSTPEKAERRRRSPALLPQARRLSLLGTGAARRSLAVKCIAPCGRLMIRLCNISRCMRPSRQPPKHIHSRMAVPAAVTAGQRPADRCGDSATAAPAPARPPAGRPPSLKLKVHLFEPCACGLRAGWGSWSRSFHPEWDARQLALIGYRRCAAPEHSDVLGIL